MTTDDRRIESAFYALQGTKSKSCICCAVDKFLIDHRQWNDVKFKTLFLTFASGCTLPLMDRILSTDEQERLKRLNLEISAITSTQFRINGLCLFCIQFHTIGTFGRKLEENLTFNELGVVVTGHRIVPKYYRHHLQQLTVTYGNRFKNSDYGFMKLPFTMPDNRPEYKCLFCKTVNHPAYSVTEYNYNKQFQFLSNVFMKPGDLPGLWRNICGACYEKNEPLIASQNIQQERERLILNQPHYWGVVDRREMHVMMSFIKQEKHQSKVFMWEFVSKNVYHRGALALGIQFRHWTLPREEYVIFKHPGAEYYFVLRGFECDQYSIFTKMHHSIDQVHDIASLRHDSDAMFLSLQAALNFCTTDHRSRFNRNGAECTCIKFSRFQTNERVDTKLVLRRHQESEILKPRVWSLQELSAHFLQSYYFHKKDQLLSLLPPVVREYVRQVYVQKLGFWSSDENPGRVKVSGFHLFN